MRGGRYLPPENPHLARWPPVKKVDKEGAVGDVSEGVAEIGDQERLGTDRLS